MLRNILKILSGNGGSKFFLFSAELLLAAALGASGYGVFSQFMAFFLVGSALFTAGTNFGTVQIISQLRKAGNDSDIRQLVLQELALFSVLALSASACIYLNKDFLSQTWLDGGDQADIFAYLAIGFTFGVLNQVSSGIFKSTRQFNSYLIVNGLFRNAALFFASLYCIFLNSLPIDYLIYIFLIGEVFGFLIGTIALFGYLSNLEGKPTSSFLKLGPLKAVFSYSLVLVIWSVLQVAAGRSQVLIAGYYLSDADVGIFNLLLRFLMFFTFFQSAVNTVYGVEIADAYNSGNKERLKNSYLRLSEALMLAASVIFILFTLGNSLAFSQLGDNYIPYAGLLPFLLCAQMLNVGSGPAGQVLIHTKNQIPIAVIALVGSLMQIGLSYFILPVYGLYGAVLLETGVILCLTGLRLAFLKSKLSFTPLTKPILRIGAVAIAISIIIGFLRQNLLDSNFITISTTMAGIILFTAFSYYTNAGQLQENLIRLMRKSKLT